MSRPDACSPSLWTLRQPRPDTQAIRLFRKSSRAAKLSSHLALGLLAGCGASPSSTGVGAPAPIAATTGPQLGYIWNATERSLRPILGIPGAAQVGQSVVPAGQYLNATTTNAVALLEDVSGYSVMALPSGTPVRLSVPAPASATSVSQLRLSPGGSSALIFSANASTVTLITGISLTVSAETDQPHTLPAPGAVLDAAVSDAGSVAVLARQAAGVEVSLLNSSGSSSTLATLAGSSAGLNFLAASAANPDDLLIADSTANTLRLIRSVALSPSPSTIPTGSLLKAPTAVGATVSGHWAAVANSAEASLVRVDLSGQAQPQKLACACQPTMITPLADDGYFRITGPPAQAKPIADPLWVAEATATPRILFIPASPASSTSPAAAPKAAPALHQTTAIRLGAR